jgi:phosphoglycolate phosphatase-like HAD superfamily hydrolase
MDEAMNEPANDSMEDVRKWAEHERHEQVNRARADLRAKRERLTDQQSDLVAEVMADLRMLSIKLGR